MENFKTTKIFYSTRDRKGKNPIQKGLVGYCDRQATGDYGPFSILRFDSNEKDTVLVSDNMLQPYIPSVEFNNEKDDVSDVFGFIGKNFAQLFCKTFFIKGDFDLRDYPYEIFDTAICAGLENLLLGDLSFDNLARDYYMFVNREYSEFVSEVYSKNKNLFDAALETAKQELHNLTQEAAVEKVEQAKETAKKPTTLAKEKPAKKAATTRKGMIF